MEWKRIILPRTGKEPQRDSQTDMDREEIWSSGISVMVRHVAGIIIVIIISIVVVVTIDQRQDVLDRTFDPISIINQNVLICHL